MYRKPLNATFIEGCLRQNSNLSSEMTFTEFKWVGNNYKYRFAD